MEWIANPESWIALLTLTALELVLGIDNIVFISILSSKLPAEKQDLARRVGLILAMLMRIVLLLFLSMIIRLTEPMFTVFEHPVSGRDLILIIGGLFLLASATREIHHKLEGDEEEVEMAGSATMGTVLAQIVMLDIVFSLDSVITAVGMVDELPIMIVAVVIAVACMMVFAKPLAEYVERHPTIKMLALSFLLLVGMTLVADGMHRHIPKGYVYFAMGFSVFVEALNLRVRDHGDDPPVKLHDRYVLDDDA